MFRKNKLVSVLLLISMFVNIGVSGEIDLLVNKLAEKGIISYSEAQEIMVETTEEIKKKIAQGKLDTLPSWIQNLAFKGDLRVRYQNDWAADTAFDRARMRLRVRLGADTRIVENVKVGFGLATGYAMSTSTNANTIIADQEPRSTNYTFSDSLSKGLLFLDYGYLEYEPMAMIKFLVGKYKNPIWQTTDLLWDTDLNHDGVAIPVSFSPMSNLNLFLVNEFMVIDELRSALPDPVMYAFQPGGSIKISDQINYKAAIAYYIFNGVEGAKLDHSKGQNTKNAGKLVMNYNSINTSSNLDINEIPFIESASIFSDYVINISTDINNIGYCVGVKIGSPKISEFGQWSAKWMYRYLEKDSWLDIFPDSDAYSGATNSQGYELIFELGLTRSTTLSIDYYAMMQILDNDPKYTKSLIQVDIVHKF